MSDEVPRAGGHDRVRPGHQQGRRARGDSSRRCRNRSSSITRRRAARAATACRRIACCCGRSATSGCWRISSSSLPIRRRRSEPGSAITPCGASWNRPSAVIGRSACISARRRSGSRATCATSAAPSPSGWPGRRSRSRAPSENAARRRWRAACAGRAPVAPTPTACSTGSRRHDELREYMREWRRAVAQRQGVPAFIVLHDTSLDDLCRRRPSSLAELLQVSGIGERKAELYGQQIFAALERFDAGARASAAVEKKDQSRRGDDAPAGGGQEL